MSRTITIGGEFFYFKLVIVFFQHKKNFYNDFIVIKVVLCFWGPAKADLGNSRAALKYGLYCSKYSRLYPLAERYFKQAAC